MRTLRLALLAALVALPAPADDPPDARAFVPLTADRKALAAGDALTVQIFESSSAASTTDTSSRRENGLSVSASTTAVDGGRPFGAAAAVRGEFDGGGTTRRSNRLLATLTVTVREILPNGELRIAGEQLVTVNDEQQHVVVEGRVRPQDVSSDNVVLSTRLADARIVFDGAGHLSNRSKRAWWRRVLDAVGF
jgi:flagellar L-ring protein precursor FlgH